MIDQSIGRPGHQAAASAEAACDRIESLLADDPGGRGLPGAAGLHGELLKAGSRLIASKRVIIVTGFLIKSKMIGETDGPVGSVSLARALGSLGAEVLIVTDDFSQALVSASAEALSYLARTRVLKASDGVSACQALLAEFKPDVVVAIERPGKATDGGFYSMAGVDMRALIPDTDALVSGARGVGAYSVAVGDGGNELGMGTIGDVIAKRVVMGHTIRAVTAADSLIVAGVSNWGAFGLVGAMSALLERDLLHSAAEEKAALEAMAAAGGVDGCTKRCEASVDGLGLERDIEMLEAVRSAVFASTLAKGDEACQA